MSFVEPIILDGVTQTPLAMKTSLTHPINISWMIPADVKAYLGDFPENDDLLDMLDPVHRPEINRLNHYNTHRGNLALSSCPGKKVRLSGPVKGRASISRDLDLDLDRMKSLGIAMIVCCLDDHELDFLGATWENYKQIATKYGIEIVRLPMQEGSAPESLEQVKNVIDRVDVVIESGKNVLAHCRGGVGRAGLFACCWLLEHELCFTAMRAVHVVRNQRSPKAIETPRQAEYIINYSIGVSQRHNKLIQKWENVEKYSLRNPRPQPTTSICPTLDLISRMEQNMMMMIQSAYPSDDANHC